MQTTKQQREARRKLVYHKHFVLGMSARAIAKEPDIEADHVTIGRDITALKKDRVNPNIDWVVDSLLAQMEHATTSERIRILNSIANIIKNKPFDDGEPDWVRWDFDTTPSEDWDPIVVMNNPEKALAAKRAEEYMAIRMEGRLN